MLTGVLPFEDLESKEVNNANVLKKMIATQEVIYPSNVSEQARNLLNKMLAKDPATRSGLLELIHDPFFTQSKVPSALPISCLSSPLPNELIQ
jgi:serine/threonine protein kinase